MAERIVLNESTMSAIGDAIREVYGEVDTYLPSEMPDKIRGMIINPDLFYVNYGAGYTSYSMSGTEIPASEFMSNSSIVGASWKLCTAINSNAFAYCSSIKDLSFPSCTLISSSAFRNCYAISEISFPACTTINANAFYYCGHSMISISLPVCTSIGTSAFYSCTEIEDLSLPACTYIGNNAFGRCTSLLRVVLMASSLCSLGGSSVFSGTHSDLLVYVPASLLSQYQVASYWSLLSSRLVGV